MHKVNYQNLDRLHEKLIGNREQTNPQYELPSGNFEFQDLVAERLRFLGSQIQEIKEDIEKRTRLTSDFKEQIEEELEEIYPELTHLQDPLFINSEDKRKSELEERFSDRKELLRDTMLEEWRDLVDMKRELRDILEEYHSLSRVLRVNKTSKE